MRLTLELTLHATQVLTAVAIGISTLEFIWIRHEFQVGGVFSEQAALSRRAFASRRRLRPPRRPMEAFVWRGFFKYQGFLSLLVARFCCSLVLVVGVGRIPSLVALGFIAATHFIIAQRTIYGLDGSDQMSWLSCMALFVGCVQPDSTPVGVAVAGFIAAQAVLAYLTAGVAKAFGGPWKTGTAVPLILSSEAWGTPRLGRLLMEHATLGKAATWLTMGWELLFPLALLHPGFAMFFLATGTVFHILNASLMGLNVFFWSFLATYPCVLYASYAVSDLLQGV